MGFGQNCNSCQNCSCLYSAQNSQENLQRCPQLIANNNNICLTRRFAFSITSRCLDQFDITTTFEAKSQNSLTYYNIYIFENNQDYANYMSCGDFNTSKTLTFESCTPKTTLKTKSSMILYQLIIQQTVMATLFYSISYGLDLIISVIFLIYGIKLLKLINKTKDQNNAQSIKIILFIRIMLLFNTSRCIVAAYFWIRSFSQNINWVIFPGLFNLKFSTYGMGIIFYVFVFIIPDTIPSIIILFILLASVQKTTNDKRLSEILLSEHNENPKRYSEF